MKEQIKVEIQNSGLITKLKSGDKENEETCIFYYVGRGYYDVYLESCQVRREGFTTEKIGYTTEKIAEIHNSVENIMFCDSFNPDKYESITDRFKEYIQNINAIRIGYPIPPKTDLSKAYLMLLYEAVLLRSVSMRKSVQYADNKFEYMYTELLRNSDIFTAPASTRFHNSINGGLVKHSLDVYNCLVDLKNTKVFRNVDVAGMTLCALTHDWCKLNLYTPYKRNIKDESTENWIQEDAYKYTYPKYPFGHGEASMYLANKYFDLTMEESLAIRWHMGKYYTDDALNNDLSEASNNYPLVNMMQFADKLAIAKY